MAQHETNPLSDMHEQVPPEVIEPMLQEHVGDETAALAALRVEPLAGVESGSGNNTLHRAHLAWTSERDASSGAVEWIVKCWHPGGLTEEWVGLTRPLEALAWTHGLLVPEALPTAFTTPFVGAALARDGTRAWVAMVDVSTELAHYSRRRPLAPEVAVRRARIVLDRFARFHAWWERPEQQEKLAGCPWLLAWEDKVWSDATTVARVLGREPAGGRGTGRQVTPDRIASVETFLEALPAGDRTLWEELLCDRRPILTAVEDVPQTLIHGDATDFNIGLRWPPGDEGEGRDAKDSTEIVLIDWEYMGTGPAALDVANVVEFLPMLCDPSQPIPGICWSDELPEYYFERYLAAGGTRLTHEAWIRSFDVAGMLPMLQVLPAFAGSTLRALRARKSDAGESGDADVAALKGLTWMWDICQQAAERVTCAARRWLV